MQWYPRLHRGARRLGGTRLFVEALELRTLPSGGPALLEAQPDDTLDQATALGALSPGSALQADGQIGDSPAGAADVDWYQFTLDQPLQVTLQAVNPSGGAAAAPVVLSLYDSDPFNFTDPYERNGHHLIAQDDATGDGAVAIDRPLAPGTYYLAVSGAGNLYFNPFVAGSGYDGQTGPYTLLASGSDLGLDPAQGPVVLASDPAPDAVLTSSPLALRLYLSGGFDVDDNPLDGMVDLSYSPDGDFADDGTDVALADTQFSAATSEALLLPAAPLAPGYYTLTLTPPDGPDDPTVPQAWSMTFQVTGVEGNVGPDAVADDTAAGAHSLGDVTNAGLVQATGVIGDDPTAPPSIKAAADVDLYHFQVSGTGSYALTAEAFAGRIGSPLNPGLSLFRLNPTTKHLDLVAGNDDTLNGQVASDGRSVPLRSDAALFAGLTAGDYYLAVSSSKNVPDPNLGLLPGQLVPRVGRIFDPNVSHSGTAGSSTGNYVLNLLVQAESDPPRVLSVTPGAGDVLDGPPTQLQVQFSEPVNLQQLAFQAYLQTTSGAVAAVYIEGSGGVRYSPRVQSFDPATNTATLLLLDALPAGAYSLHLSGPLGLADVSGDPLVGNDPGGDYVVPFEVAGPARGTGGDPLTWTYADSDQAPVHQQSLGVLFPYELQAGVNIVRQPSPGASRPQPQDSYLFAVTEEQRYLFNLTGASLPAGVTFAVFDAAGHLIPTSPVAGGAGQQASLSPGVYSVVIQGWTADEASAVGYQLAILLGGAPDSPVALTSGPAPAIRLRLDAPVTPPTPITPPTSVAPPTPASDTLSPTVNPGGAPQTKPSSGPIIQVNAGPAATTPETDNSAGAASSPPQLVIPIVEVTPASPGHAATLQVNWTGSNAAGNTPASGKPASPPQGGNVVTPVALIANGPQGAVPQGGFNLPFSLLAVLGTSPAGTAAPSSLLTLSEGPPRLILDLPDPALVEAVLRPVVLTPLIGVEPEEAAQPLTPDPRGAEPGEAAPAVPAARALAAPRAHEWARDAWFRRLQLGRLLPLGIQAAIAQQQESAAVGGEGGDDEAELDLPDEVETGSAAPSWAATLTLLGAAGIGRERRRQEVGTALTQGPVWQG